MAHDVTLMGATYPAVPAILVPSGQGTARFTDVTDTTAAASDVASGKYFYTAAGVRTAGTSSGGVDSTFVITVSYNSQTQMWEPDCTYAEAAAAYQAGKELVAEGPTIEDMVAADCVWNADQSVLYYLVYFLSSSTQWACQVYALSSNGIEFAWDDYISVPTGTITIANSGNTNVAGYATASVPNAQYDLSAEKEYYTQSSMRKWRFRPIYEGWNAGWMTSGTKYGSYVSYNAIPANTTVTPSTSSQTIGGADYMMEGAVTVAAMPTGTAGTPTATKGAVSNHAISVTPSVVNTTGYITGGTKTGTAVSVSASELVSGTYTVGASGTHDVTNYASASVASGGATASATKGTVSNHSVTVTPSVTRTAGYVTAGSSNGTAVTVSASELVSGSETKTANGTYDVTNLAQLVVDVQGGGSSMQVDFSEASTTVATSISFSGLSGEPTSFSIVSATDISTGTPSKIAAIVFDGTDIHAQTITNTSNAQVSYDGSNLSKSYSNGTLTIVSTGAQFVTGENYWMSYTYGGTAGNIQTEDVQVGSGATSITFAGLPDEPKCWSCIFKSDFSTSNGYQRVICVRYDGEVIEGMAMDSAAHYSDGSWNYSYSSGSLTISSAGTNNGGYFHQPGYYQLTYAIGEVEPPTIEPLTVTQNGVYSEAGKAYSPVTVNVSGGSSKNVQTAQSTTRSTSSSGTQVISLTCSKAGTYTVRWSTFRSSTSGTWGSRLYIGGSAYEAMHTDDWSNHIQNREVTGVSISANQSVAVYVQSRGSNYYGYVGTLTIIQTA